MEMDMGASGLGMAAIPARRRRSPALAFPRRSGENVQILQFVQNAMHSLPLTEFRANVSAMLDLVEQGQTVRILRHGKAVAELVPVKAEEPAAEKKLPSWKKPFEPLIKRPPGSKTGAQLIIEERESSPW
jgi:prevent-host-death family protein